MSDQHDDTEPSDIAELRNAAELGRTARAEADAARRELAFAKAGVDTDTKIGKMLLQTYDGPLERDAITAEAIEVGAIKVVTEEAPVEVVVLEQGEAHQQQERAGLASEAVAPTQQSDVHPALAGLDAFQQRLREGATREAAGAEFIDRVIDAAVKGDQRVLIDPRSWADAQAKG